MPKRRFFTTSAMCLSILFVAAASAFAAKVENTYPAPGVRPQAMGGAFVAVADDVNAIFYNPAGLALIQKRQVQITHTDLYGLGIDYNYLAYSQPKFGVAWAHYGASSDFLLGGGEFNNDMLILSGAYQVDPQTYVGASFKMLKSKFTAPGTIDTSRAAGIIAESIGDEGISIDLGVLHKVDEVTTVGALVRDIYGYKKTVNSLRTSEEDNFKPRIIVGFARRTAPDMMFTLELDGIGKETLVHLGVEKKMQDQLTLRAGLDDDVFTAGLGFNQNDWQFDYSFKNSIGSGLDKTQRFGATVKF